MNYSLDEKTQLDTVSRRNALLYLSTSLISVTSVSCSTVVGLHPDRTVSGFGGEITSYRLPTAVGLRPDRTVSGFGGEITTYRLSPDGSAIVFENGGFGLQDPKRVGVYDWRTDRLRWVPNPDGYYIGIPAFSPDGQSFVALGRRVGYRVWNSIFKVDVLTLEAVKFIFETEDREQDSQLIEVAVQPRTGHLLVVVRRGFKPLRLELYDEKGSKLQTYSGIESFGSVFNISFPQPDDIIFQAIGFVPRGVVDKSVQALNPEATWAVVYKLKLGGLPNVLFPSLETTRRRGTFDAVFYCYSTSENEKVSFGTLQGDAADRILRKSSPKKLGAVVSVDSNAELTILSDASPAITNCAVSFDGSVVAFNRITDARGVPKDYGGHADINIFDRGSHRVFPLRLREKIA